MVEGRNWRGHPGGFMSKNMRAFTVAVALGLLLTNVGNLRAAEVKVLAVAAFVGAFNDIIPPFERTSGHKVVVQYQASPVLLKQIEAGEQFDVAVLVASSLDDPAKQAYFTGPRHVVSSVGLGAAVRAGAPKPDLTSAASLKQALLNCKSVAILPESLNGQHFMRMFERLGIAEEMKPKIKAQKRPEDVAGAVAKGEAELGLFVTNLLVSVPGVDYAGPVPGEFQQILVLSAAAGAKAKEHEAANALLKHLTLPSSAAAMRAHGMDAP